MKEELGSYAKRPCRVCQIWLTCEVLNAVTQQAEEEGISDSKLIERILRQHLGMAVDETDE